MAEYYFLASLLPSLAIGHVPDLDFHELKELFRINLTDEDKEKVHQLLSLIDLENLRAFWAKQSHDPRGNYSRAEIEQSLQDKSWPGDLEWPSYLKEFIEKYHDDKEKIEHFSELLSTFLKVEASMLEEGFLKEYFIFLREWNLIMVGFRAKKLGRNLAKELQYEDPKDPIVAEILAQKDAPVYEPPYEYKELKSIFLEFSEFPLELHKALLAYSFRVVEELCGNEFFSIDRLLGFMARLLMVEKWLELDMQKGLAILGKIEENIR